MIRYFAFADPSGGSSDSFTLAIARRSLTSNRVILVGSWERKPPFSPDSVCSEFAAILKDYGLMTVVGDRYAGEWPRERFREYGISYEASERTKSEIYVAFVALINSGRVKFPADKRLRAQLEALERRVSRTGKDVIDHLPGSHDDVANAVAGALVLASARAKSGKPFATFIPLGGPYPKTLRDLNNPFDNYGFSPSSRVPNFARNRF